MANPQSPMFSLSIELNNLTKSLASLEKIILNDIKGRKVSVDKSLDSDKLSEESKASLSDEMFILGRNLSNLGTAIYPLTQATQFQQRYTSIGVDLNKVLTRKLEVNASELSLLEGAVNILTVGLGKSGKGVDKLAFRSEALGENTLDNLDKLRDVVNSLGLNSEQTGDLALTISNYSDIYRTSSESLITALNGLRDNLSLIKATGSGVGIEKAIADVAARSGMKTSQELDSILGPILDTSMESLQRANILGYQDLYDAFLTDPTGDKLVSIMQVISNSLNEGVGGIHPVIARNFTDNIAKVSGDLPGKLNSVLMEINSSTKSKIRQDNELNNTLKELQNQFLSPLVVGMEYISIQISKLNTEFGKNLVRNTAVFISIAAASFTALKLLTLIRLAVISSSGVIGVALAALGTYLYSANQKQDSTIEELQKINKKAETRDTYGDLYGLSQSVIAKSIDLALSKKGIEKLGPDTQDRLMLEQNSKLTEINNNIRILTSSISKTQGFAR